MVSAPTDILDQNYYRQFYQAKSVQDLASLVVQIHEYNRKAGNISINLSKCAKAINDIPDGADWSSLSDAQKADIADAVKELNKAQSQFKKDTKNPTLDPDIIQQRNETWQQILKAQTTLGRYKGWLKNSSAVGNVKPTLSPRNLPKNQSDAIQAQSSQDVALERATQRRAQTVQQNLQATQVVPPLPPPASPSSQQPPQQKDDKKISIIDVLVTALDSVAKGIETFGQALGQFLAQLGRAYATMMSAFGNILDSPLESAVGVISGMTQMIGQSYQLIGGLIKTVLDIFSSFLSLFTGSDDDEKGKASPIAKIVQVVTQIVSAIINLVVQQIQAGFSIFASTLEAVFKIIKKIQETSPIVRAILDLLNLAFNLFFMPFMNQFALVLLDTVLELLRWAIEKGDELASLGQSMLNILEESGFSIDDILESVMVIGERFVKEFLPPMLELLPGIVDFAVQFTETILKNKDSLLGFIEKGLKAFSDMLSTGMLTTFIEFGQKTMQWVSDNAVNIVSFLGTLLNQALNIATWFMGFLGGDASQSLAVKDDFNKSLEQLKEEIVSLTIDESTVNSPTNRLSESNWFTNTTTGGIPTLPIDSGSSEYAMTDQQLEQIGRDVSVLVRYEGDVESKGDLETLIRNTVSEESNKSRFR